MNINKAKFKGEKSMDTTKLMKDISKEEENKVIDEFVDYLDYTCGLAGRTASDKRTLKEKLKKFIHGEDYTR